MTQIVIFGTGKIADVLHAYIREDPTLSIAGFTCDPGFMTEREFHGLPLVPFEEVETAFPSSDFAMFVAIGYQDLNPGGRSDAGQAREQGLSPGFLDQPRALVPKGCTVGANCFVMEGALIAAICPPGR